MLEEVEKALEADRARLAEQQAKDEVQKRYRLFLDRRKEALFRDTQFSGLMLPTNLDLTRKAAEQALGVFAHQGHEDDWAVGRSSRGARQRTAGRGQGRLLRAALGPGRSGGHPGREAGRPCPADPRECRPIKAQSLTSIPSEESVFAWRGRNDRAGEARELAEAQRVRRETAFDYFLSGQQEYKRHRWPDAIQDFEIALRKKPDHFWAQCMLANCYLRTSRPEAAKSCLYFLPPDRPRPRLAVSPARLRQRPDRRQVSLPGQEQSGAGGALNASAEFEFEEAEADFQEALARLERTPDDELHYELLVNRGFFRVQRGRLDQAAADYQEAIRLKKDLYLAHADLAQVYQKQAKPTEAMEQFTQAIALKPDWAPLYRGRAELLGSLGRLDPRAARGGPVRSGDGDPPRAGRQSGPGPGPYQSGQAALSR